MVLFYNQSTTLEGDKQQISLPRLAVLGADSFVGKTLYQYCLEKGIDVIGTSRRAHSALNYLDFLAPNLQFMDKNVTHAIITAARPVLSDCEKDPDGTFAMNVTGTKKVIEQLWDLGITPVFFSSDYVFAGKEGILYKEESEYGPSTEYGKQKMTVEKFLREQNYPYLIVRLSKVYGLQKGDGTLLDNMASRLKSDEVISMVSNQWFCPIWVRDIASGIVFLAKNDIHGIIHFCSSELLSRYDISMLLVEQMRLPKTQVMPMNVHDLPDKVDRPQCLMMSNEKWLSLANASLMNMKLAVEKIVSYYA
jgi:dTDP-4-dehydrorhamnose reductase